MIVSADKIPAEHDAIPDYKRIVGNVFSTRDHGTIGIRTWWDGHLTISRNPERSPEALLSLAGRQAA